MLPPNLNIALAGTTITPYIPVPDTNGEEWDRLEPASLLDALIELVLNGEYNGILDGGKRTKEGLELRTSAAVVFEVCVQGSSCPSSHSHMSCRTLLVRMRFVLQLCSPWHRQKQTVRIFSHQVPLISETICRTPKTNHTAPSCSRAISVGCQRYP